MANTTDPFANSVHGTNPQYLIEKITRLKIYNAVYWKEECFGLTAATIIDKAVELKYYGGTYGGNLKPCKFLCLLLKLLQLQPDKEIVYEFIRNEDFPYLRILGAFYLRLVGKAEEIYQYLEPLYNDYRRLNFRSTSGAWVITHVDELIDALLREELVCDIALPHLTKRVKLEELGVLPIRKSALDDELDELEKRQEEEEEEGESEDEGGEDSKDGEKGKQNEENTQETQFQHNGDYERKAEDSKKEPAAVTHQSGNKENTAVSFEDGEDDEQPVAEKDSTETKKETEVGKDQFLRKNLGKEEKEKEEIQERELGERRERRSTRSKSVEKRRYEKNSRDRRSRSRDNRHAHRKSYSSDDSRDDPKYRSKRRSRSRSPEKRRRRDSRDRYHDRRRRERSRSWSSSDEDKGDKRKRKDDSKDRSDKRKLDDREEDRKRRKTEEPSSFDQKVSSIPEKRVIKQDELIPEEVKDVIGTNAGSKPNEKQKKNEKVFDKMFGKKKNSSSTSGISSGAKIVGKEIIGVNGQKFVITAPEGTVEYWNQIRESLGMKKLK